MRDVAGRIVEIPGNSQMDSSISLAVYGCRQNVTATSSI
jgi:hypothetical protein